ncbi:S41 family peptidase, partial [Rhizobium johnstonii]|uniref:S41 family peptidase n=1 Tax=Rhizobium johnstonii TaxID=3019933 RepID=UPI003F9AFABF
RFCSPCLQAVISKILAIPCFRSILEPFLGELSEEKVDSVLIDLRKNGGGSLDEEIDLTGLFIGNGPVVQQRGSDGKVEVRSSDLAAPVWT